MTDQFDEKISSLVDGELGEAEYQQTVTAMLADEEKCHCWERYHLISNAMKRNLPHAIDRQFASRVKAEIDNEPTVLAPPSHKAPSFGKRMAGLAVAASVATVAVLGVQFMYQEDGMVSTQQMAKVPVPDVKTAKAPVNQTHNRQDIQTVTQSFQQSPVLNQPSKQMLPQIHKYLLDHSRRASGSMPQSVMPYNRVIPNPDTDNIAQQKQNQVQNQR